MSRRYDHSLFEVFVGYYGGDDWLSSMEISREAARIMDFIFNLGHNRDNSFRQKSFIIRSVVSTWRYTYDTLRHLFVFPLDSLKVWGRMVWNGVRGRG